MRARARWPIFAARVHKRRPRSTRPTTHSRPPPFVAANVVALTANFRYYRIVIADTVISSRPRRGNTEGGASSCSSTPAHLALPSANTTPEPPKLSRTAAGVLSVRSEHDLRERPIVARDDDPPLTIHYRRRREGWIGKCHKSHGYRTAGGADSTILQYGLQRILQYRRLRGTMRAEPADRALRIRRLGAWMGHGWYKDEIVAGTRWDGLSRSIARARALVFGDGMINDANSAGHRWRTTR